MAQARNLTDYANAEEVKRMMSSFRGEQASSAAKNIKRFFSADGNPLIHASELYSIDELGLTEAETLRALNILVLRGDAKLINKKGLLWYYLI